MKQAFARVLIMVLTSCSNGGGGKEAAASKYEWSILQNLESSSREQLDLSFQLLKVDVYSIVLLPNNGGKGAIYIMLNPKSPPYYKQMPNKQFTITKDQFRQILSTDAIISDVEEALRSHIYNESS
jgi:hypothetical protein